MPTEADTCRRFVVPKLQAAGWDNEPFSIAEQRTITDGRIVPVGKSFIRRPSKRVDYLLRYRRDFNLAVVEAKPEYKTAADALQQAKQYAEMLGLKFAYASNGPEILEFDYFTGRETKIESYPAPEQLWQRFRKGESLTNDTEVQQLLTPINFTLRQGERYYQEIAINRTVEAIVTGKRRILLTMATGTGKTPVAFQICWKLWNARWNRTGEHRRPKILYLSDRNILIDDPKDKIFAQFGDARAKIEYGNAIKSREIYFAIYQALAKDERRPGLYKEYAPDFFDLIIIDECHRGSAREESNWREILEYFEPAYQLGMTATPLRDETRDTYLYFGNPIYQYSLRQGIEDGFLAPYRVHRVITQWDVAGWRPSKGDIGRGHLSRFQDVESRSPVILTTSQLLTTGVDAPTCKNIVIARVVGSLTEFKQIIGRGTRVRDDYGKLWFNIIDYTGSATQRFADPDFDGDPAFISQEEVDAAGKTTNERIIDDGLPPLEGEDKGPIVIDEAPTVEPRKYYFDEGHVEIASHLVYELDPDGKQLRVLKYSDYAAEKVRTLYPSAPELRQKWANPAERSEIIDKLAQRGISFDELAETAKQPNADPFDLLCHLAFNAPLRTRRERAQRLREERKDFFDQYGPDAHAVLDELLDKYAEHGTAQFVLPDVLKVPPISERGNVIEIAKIFGGSEKLRDAVSQLQTLLYAA